MNYRHCHNIVEKKIDSESGNVNNDNKTGINNNIDFY